MATWSKGIPHSFKICCNIWRPYQRRRCRLNLRNHSTYRIMLWRKSSQQRRNWELFWWISVNYQRKFPQWKSHGECQATRRHLRNPSTFSVTRSSAVTRHWKNVRAYSVEQRSQGFSSNSLETWSEGRFATFTDDSCNLWNSVVILTLNQVSSKCCRWRFSGGWSYSFGQSRRRFSHRSRINRRSEEVAKWVAGKTSWRGLSLAEMVVIKCWSPQRSSTTSPWDQRRSRVEQGS